MMTNFRPLGDKVLLMFPQPGAESDGVVSDNSRRMDAVVAGVGSMVSDEIRVGQTVVADRTTGLWLVVDGVHYRLVAEKDIIGAENE